MPANRSPVLLARRAQISSWRAVVYRGRNDVAVTEVPEPITMADVLAEGFEALRAGQKMKVLVDPTR